MSRCSLCPRECGADRERGEVGFCGVGSDIRISKIMLHEWEEPCICRGAGAGAVFFSGCNLGCVYCQNYKISRGGCGEVYTQEQLADEILSLQSRGASCIDLVTPTHYTDTLAAVLRAVKPCLHIPVVWNSGGYEKVESLRLLDGLVDIYLPDIKYFSGDIAKKYSFAEDYFEVAEAAFLEMYSQVGQVEFSPDGALKKGIIARHLVLPGCREDSSALLARLSTLIPSPSCILLSLMSQYTPDFYVENNSLAEHKSLARRLTSFEYDSVMRTATALGFEGYFQKLSSANKKFTPDF